MPSSKTLGVATDVAFRLQWSGSANPDGRYFSEVTAAELPWPLRFAFVQAVEDDGSQRWVCTGVEIGRPILREEEGLETDGVELTLPRFLHISENFDRYRMMAEMMLIPTEENREHMLRIRRGMSRKHGERMTAQSLREFVNEWRALEDDPDGRTYKLAKRWGCNLATIHRWLDRAEAEGLIEPGERTRRPQK